MTEQRKILVVEDSTDTREMLALLLCMEGFAVISAADGREGFDKAVTEQPDLIITDINMPEINGIEMIRLLRNRPDLKRVPILVATAYTDGTAARATDVGATRVIYKPVPFESLAEVINQLLAFTEGKGSF